MTVTSLNSERQQNETSLEIHEGMGAFVVLVGADGIVDAKLVDGKYGKVWLLSDNEEINYGRKWVPADGSHVAEDHKQSRIQRELGLQQMIEIAPAFLSRNGDICREGDWKEYGSWKGIPFWDNEYNIWED